MADAAHDSTTAPTPRIRRATSDDLKQVIDLDTRITSAAKPDYWQDIFERYGSRRLDQRFFLIAEHHENRASERAIVGMIIGEVRGWEFGSRPCGWIFAISVDPDHRQMHVGEHLFRAICDEFRKVGITKVRTMVQRQNMLHMSFFRGEGMVAGPYTQLELDLDDT